MGGKRVLIGACLIWLCAVGAIPEAQTATCELLAGLFGSARVLCVTRGFRSMVFSSYSQFVRSGGTTGFPEFCDSIRAADLVWDYDRVLAPNRTALVWWYLASYLPEEFEEWLAAHGRI